MTDDLEVTIRPEVTCRSLLRRWRWTVRTVAGPPSVYLRWGALASGFAVTESGAKAKADRAVAELRDEDRRWAESVRRTRTYRP